MVMAQKNIKKVIKDFITYVQTPTKKGVNLQIFTKNKNYIFKCVE